MAADLLEEQRNLIFEALKRQMGFYDSADSQGLMQSIMGMVGGQDQPFTNEVRQNMLADNADASAGGYNSNRDMIQRAMSNAGLTGSGLEASALLSAQTQQGRMARQGRREVNTRAQLENYSARERAQTTAMNYLAQQETARRATTMAEVDQRGKMHATGDATNVAQATGSPTPGQVPGVMPQAPQPALSTPKPARPTQYGLSNVTLLQKRPTVVQPFGVAGGGGLQYLQGAGQYDQGEVQKQQQDRSYLQQLQADWDTRYGGR